MENNGNGLDINNNTTLQDGLMKQEGELADRPCSSVVHYLQTGGRKAQYVVGAAALLLILFVGGSTTALSNQLIRRRHNRSVQCGERLHQVAVNHNYGDSYPYSYNVRLLSCTTSTQARILLIDDLWGRSIAHSEGSTSRSGPDGTGLVGYGLFTYSTDGNVAYHYTYTIGDGFSDGNNKNDETLHVTFNNGVTYDVDHDVVLLISTQDGDDDENTLQVQEIAGDDVNLAQVASSKTSTSSAALQSLVDGNDSIAAFLAQSMANFIAYDAEQQEQQQQEEQQQQQQQQQQEQQQDEAGEEGGDN